MVFENISDGEGKAKTAFQDVTKYTWQKRAENIIDAIKSI
jgi:hypothetical protein